MSRTLLSLVLGLMGLSQLGPSSAPPACNKGSSSSSSSNRRSRAAEAPEQGSSNGSSSLSSSNGAPTGQRKAPREDAMQRDRVPAAV
mmetsp:Transcript_11245/g.30680  ORF Transcript_11245/g.30680 Transcript_11245/m.30680 type:complete len:87 (+) Transcript_11245:424-684(+)